VSDGENTLTVYDVLTGIELLIIKNVRWGRFLLEEKISGIYDHWRN
jgi:hypothetical protein